MSVLQTVRSIIPPPAFMQMPSVGIDISDSSLRYVCFCPSKANNSRLELDTWGDIELDNGILSKGIVQDEKKLTEVLQEVRKRTGVDAVRVSLPEEYAHLFHIEIQKGTSFREIRGLLEFHIEEKLPLSARDVFFDYDVVDKSKDSRALSVTVVVYPKDIILSYYRACTAAGCLPLSFEVGLQAIARAVLPQNDIHTHIIVDFGKSRTGIGIVHNNVLAHTSTIAVGIDDLSKLPTLSTISEEITSCIQYWNSEHSHLSDSVIESIVVCGESAHIQGLPEYFTNTLEITTHRAEVWLNAFSVMDYIPPIDKAHSYAYATAIGLAVTTDV